jgi:hypothetical protein
MLSHRAAAEVNDIQQANRKTMMTMINSLCLRPFKWSTIAVDCGQS